MLAAAGNSFETFGSAHVAAMGVIAVVAAALPVWARRARSAKVTQGIRWAVAVALLANELGHYVYVAVTDGVGALVTASLPLHVCGLAIYLTAWTLWRRGQWAYELAWFWGIGGTVQAIATPNLMVGFPDYRFFQFFATHGGIVVGVVFATWGLRMRPGRGSVLRAFLISNVLVGVVAGADWLLGANYMFLCGPPAGASPLFFLPWPWYILFLEGFGLLTLGALYLPFVLAERLGARRGGRARWTRLPSGRRVLLRPLRADDADLLARYFLGLSAHTKALYAPHAFDRATAETLCAEIDETREIRLIAVTGPPGLEEGIGYVILSLGVGQADGGRYAERGMAPDAAGVCAVAPSVADAYQNHRLGSAMMRHVIGVARRLGRERMILTGGVLAENARAIHFYRKHGFETVGRFGTERASFDMMRTLD